MSLMTRKQTAKYLGISYATLEKWAKQKKGPPVIRLEKSIRYDFDDLKKWIELRKNRQNHE